MKSIIKYFNGFRQYRYLLKLRISFEIRSKYKNSFLGVVWSLLSPLFQMLVLSVVFSKIFESRILNFPLFMISGKIIFDFFAVATSGSLMSICGAADLIKKVYFPKYIIVLSNVTASFLIMMISMIDLLLVMLFTGASFSVYLFYAPIYLLLLYVFVVGCSLILATLNVFFRDIEHFYGIIIIMLMYLSALFYPPEIIPEAYQKILFFNPIFHYIVGFRFSVYYALPPDYGNLLYCTVTSILALGIGLWVFIKKQDQFVLYI